MRAFFLLLSMFTSSVVLGSEVTVPRTKYVPIFRDPGEPDIYVGPLSVDVTPVTNQEFLQFLRLHRKFSRAKIASLYADSGYLSHWMNSDDHPESEANYPVTNVSWFVARKYCEAGGKRLPTIAEWEVLSDARSKANEARILEWYSNPNSSLRTVRDEPKNRFGIKGAHALIWEWVENYSESIMSGDSRGGSSTERLYCGGAALKAKDPTQYATFMRFAFRSSLSAKYTSKNLGFRCVRDLRSPK